MINKFNKVNHRGFSMIEVLIALLILAVGVLGIAALQFKALKYGHDAFLRSQINFLAYDIADRIRNNRANKVSYLGNYTVTLPVGDNACVQATATAANDLGCWRNSVENGLPPGSTAHITVTGTLYTVAMGWADREGQTHTVQYTFDPGT